MLNKREILLDSEEEWYEEHSDEFIPASQNIREQLIQAAKVSAQKTERMEALSKLREF
ncbi:MAG: hypothetical protein ACOZCE_01555 [Spirochaetota bacterium]|jgi:hypothetical protein|uniref:hypothetical protein n=1 Tax=Gracilinema caldarium TaxID=215591 RepID=UPI0016A0E189|nr:hypothetical protein [Gracilinema caldarium]NLJ08877.1 hypothetical protein [Treponema sp.]